MAKKHRSRNIPDSATSRPDEKRVRIPESTVSKYPSWQFSTADIAGSFAWPASKNTELEILNKLREFDGMTWSEIEGASHHSIKVGDLSKDARRRLEAIRMDDIEEVFTFRLSGKKRVVCIRDNSVAKLLWWDPEHKVCPSKKKHT